MTPTDSICEVKTNISTKGGKEGRKNVCRKVYKLDGKNTKFSHTFSSTLISQRCFLRIWGRAKYILIDCKSATS